MSPEVEAASWRKSVLFFLFFFWWANRMKLRHPDHWKYLYLLQGESIQVQQYWDTRWFWSPIWAGLLTLPEKDCSDSSFHQFLDLVKEECLRKAELLIMRDIFICHFGQWHQLILWYLYPNFWSWHHPPSQCIWILSKPNSTTTTFPYCIGLFMCLVNGQAWKLPISLVYHKISQLKFIKDSWVGVQSDYVSRMDGKPTGMLHIIVYIEQRD